MSHPWINERVNEWAKRVPGRASTLWGSWRRLQRCSEEGEEGGEGGIEGLGKGSDGMYWRRRRQKMVDKQKGRRKQTFRKDREKDMKGWGVGYENQDKSGAVRVCEGGLGRPVPDNVTWHTLLILAQWRDPASPSAQGQGRSLGSASHPPPPTHTLPLPAILALQTPGQAHVHFHKTIASQPAPVSGGWGQEGSGTPTSFPQQWPVRWKGPGWTWYTLQKSHTTAVPRAWCRRPAVKFWAFGVVFFFSVWV